MNQVSIRKEGRAGRITMNRPQALNALTLEMSIDIFDALGTWADDPDVAFVLLDAEGDRAFCAGGDLARIYDDARDNNGTETIAFWKDEYELNVRIAQYAKPIVVFMQGFVMGGGVGLAGHASHRIACESTQIAMPECAIGLIPDVGGSYLLSRAPGSLGEYLGVTGARMGSADAIHAGFADVFIPVAAWDGLKSDLTITGDLSLIKSKAVPPEDGQLAAVTPLIDSVFSAPDLPDMANRLDTEDNPLALAAKKAMSRNSPLSMHTALEMIRRARQFGTIRQAIGLEFRAAARTLLEGDFVEGIRAQIIDKDRSPRWKHATLDQVTAKDVQRMLRPFDDSKMEFEENPE